MSQEIPWYEDDAFWSMVGPILFSDQRREAAGAEVDQLLALTATAPTAAVLDLACGVGRHSLELARRGFQVTGVDRTQPFVDEARAQATREGVAVTFETADMRDFEAPAQFDFAICLFTSFGYFDDAALRGGGRCVLDIGGKEELARQFRERDWQETTDGTLLLEERRPGPNWEHIRSRWVVIKGTTRREFTVVVRAYSAVELGALLREAGFSQIQMYGGLDGSPYDHNAKRLVAVATK